MLSKRITIALCFFAVLNVDRIAHADHLITDHGAVAGDQQLDTSAVQAAIDAAAAEDEDRTVTIPAGTFLSGSLILKSGVTLNLNAEAILQGSDNPGDYGQGRWQDALIQGENVEQVCIQGKGVIDGADCRNPKGEEGFRGPHGIRLMGCKGIVIHDVTIKRTGNYAILCQDSEQAEIRNVTIRGGHDGLHAQNCRTFDVQDCDLRTGDDCFAGCDNKDFSITGCKINSSCNGFRLGCVNLVVKKCRIWGPGEFQHQVSSRQNMLSAFVHFAPRDRHPQLPSDHWIIEDVTIENVGFVYGYDIEHGLWQQGQPAKQIRFQNVTATQVEQPIRVLGDADHQFQLTLSDVSIALCDNQANQPVLNLTRFGALRLRHATLRNDGRTAVLQAKDGNTVSLEEVTCLPDNKQPFHFEQVEQVVKIDASNRLGELITIPAGPFLMGNNGEEPFSPIEELPQHTVDLPTYQIGKYEVTRGQYRRFIEAGGYQDPSYWSAEGWKWKQSDVIDYAGMYGKVTHTVRPNSQQDRNEPEHWSAEQEWIGHGYDHPRFIQTDDHPVVGVTYYEAEAYGKWAGGRLPTEAEWEKAARWDTKQQHANTWPWGDTWDAEKCNWAEDHHPVAGGYKKNQSAPVGSYPDGASPYGCLDMVGNAYEWVADWYQSYPGSTKPFDYTNQYHVVKGACWDDGPIGVRCAYRGWYLPPSSSGTGPGDSDYIGFRVAR